MSAPVNEYLAWMGRTQEKTAVVPPTLDGVLRGVLNVPDDLGGDLLHGLHWLLFDEFVPAAEIGSDGHPRRGGFLPPIELPRRMWAGSRIDFVKPLRAGAEVTRRSTIASVTPKDGKAGPLVFVTVDHEISAAGDTLIREQQDIVYMNIAAAAPRPVLEQFDSETDSWNTVTPDQVMLFRYSALTHNSHRIHYDADYAREVELYPALVVHGPLTATLLMWSATRAAGDQPLAHFTFRGQSPLYVGDPIRLEVDHTADGLVTTARNVAGATAMRGTATVRR